MCLGIADIAACLDRGGPYSQIRCLELEGPRRRGEKLRNRSERSTIEIHLACSNTLILRCPRPSELLTPLFSLSFRVRLGARLFLHHNVKMSRTTWQSFFFQEPNIHNRYNFVLTENSDITHNTTLAASSLVFHFPLNTDADRRRLSYA